MSSPRFFFTPAKQTAKRKIAAHRDERRSTFRAVLFLLGAVLVTCATIL
jgi:hypothetical protein